MYSDQNVINITPGYGSVRFSRREILNIIIAAAVLTAAFTIFFLPSAQSILKVSWQEALPYALGISAFVTVVGFLLHEFAHKFLAQKYGAWAEFGLYPLGLLMCLVFSFFGFIFAAPGAVYIQGNITKRQYGIISIAGPLTNLAFGIVFMLLWIFVPVGVALGFAFYMIGFLSVWMALFNLIPFPPFDGSKVIVWSVPIWAMTFAVSVFFSLIGWGVIIIR
ncbi:MAG: site-2 protease family protein [Methanomassiliicoccales archaeon]